MWIVTKDNPCYPSVRYAATRQQAEAIAEEWVNELHDLCGHHKCSIVIAEVRKRKEIKTCY